MSAPHLTGNPPGDQNAHPGFAHARAAADAVLFEGYVLYPYRASAAKNQMRWQFGVLMPPSVASRHGEHVDQVTMALLEGTPETLLTVELRFLHAQRRTVRRLQQDGRYYSVDHLPLDDRVLVPWDEAVEERVELSVTVQELLDGGHTRALAFPATESAEPVRDTDERTLGQLLRRRAPLAAEVTLALSRCPGPYGALRLTATVRNTTTWRPGAGEDGRDTALSRSLLSTHLLLGLSDGNFLSMTDPPEWARPMAEECHSARGWPVLAGPPGEEHRVLLSSPIILQDHPEVAQESVGAMYDATEIDEILALRTVALTEQEKREARGTDARAAAVVEQADTMPPQVWERLHGVIRELRPAAQDSQPDSQLDVQPPAAETADGESADGDELSPSAPWWDPATDRSFDPASDQVWVGETLVGAGSRVVLWPDKRRGDAQDLFLYGHAAQVEAVLRDVDGDTYLAVVQDGDPGSDLRRVQGRFLYFRPDEVTVAEET